MLKYKIYELTSAWCRWSPFRGIVGRGCPFPHPYSWDPLAPSFNSETDKRNIIIICLVMVFIGIKFLVTHIKQLTGVIYV